MKVYEFLSLHKEFLKMLHSFGISFDDCKWVELYHEYKKLKEKEHKMVYIASYYYVPWRSEDSAWLTGYLMRKLVRLYGEPCN